MKYTRKKFKLEDYFEGEELEKIKRELDQMEKEELTEEKTYTFEEVLENLEIENKEEFLQEIQKDAENRRKKYLEKCKKVIKQHYTKINTQEFKEYIS